MTQVQHEPRVLPAHHSVNDLKQVPAVDTDVTVPWQVVAVDAHLLVKYLYRSNPANDIILVYVTSYVPWTPWLSCHSPLVSYSDPLLRLLNRIMLLSALFYV